MTKRLSVPLRITPILSAIALLTACTHVQTVQNNLGEAAVVRGPSVSDNKTPLDEAFVCVSDKIRALNAGQVAISVGNIKDYTGKYSESEGGSLITQGGALMVISALGKFGDVIALRERFDTAVAELENDYAAQRRLGDGQRHAIVQDGVQTSVPYLPAKAGRVLRSQVYIVGGITELNFDISSGGGELFVQGTGGGARTYVVNVAVDLRLVNATNLNVLKTVSYQKQVIGYEVKAGVFDFFGTTLVDLNAGRKSQEPLQLAVRTVLEMATMDLVSHIYAIDPQLCIAAIEEPEPALEPEPTPEPVEVDGLPEPYMPPPMPEPLVAEVDMEQTAKSAASLSAAAYGPAQAP